MFYLLLCFVFFFKQKTAYEMRISDWSSDVCSSDLPPLSEVLSMTMIPASAAASPTAPHALGHIPNPTAAIFQAAQRLLSNLDHGQRIDAPILRAAMEAAFGASDATGAWDWKSAYEA